MSVIAPTPQQLSTDIRNLSLQRAAVIDREELPEVLTVTQWIDLFSPYIKQETLGRARSSLRKRSAIERPGDCHSRRPCIITNQICCPCQRSAGDMATRLPMRRQSRRPTARPTSSFLSYGKRLQPLLEDPGRLPSHADAAHLRPAFSYQSTPKRQDLHRRFPVHRRGRQSDGEHRAIGSAWWPIGGRPHDRAIGYRMSELPLRGAMFSKRRPDDHSTKPVVDAYVANLPRAISDQALEILLAFHEYAMCMAGEFIDESMHDIVYAFLRTLG